MRAVFAAIGASRRAANVAMLTWSSWFADVGSESTDAGCASDLFSEASAAAVTCAIMKPELTPPSSTRNGGRPERFVSISSAMRRSDSAPDLGDREREVVRRERDRLGVEVAAREDLVRVREDQRIVGHRVRFGEQHAGRVTHLVEARAHHLRLAAQAVRILHARAVLVRRADRAAGEQRAVDRGRVRLTAMAAHRVDARVERRVAAEARVDRQRARDERGGQRALGGEQSGERERRRHLRAVEEREALLRTERDRLQARLASASRAGTTRPSNRASPSPISTAARCASGARSPEAPTEPCAGMHGTTPALASATSASMTLQRTPEWPRASDAALSATTSRTTASSSSAPVPAECDSTSARCSSASRASSIRVRASKPEAGVDAVDRPTRGDDAVDRLRGGLDRGSRDGIDDERHRRRPQPAEIGELQKTGNERQGGHRRCASRGSALCRIGAAGANRGARLQ